MQTEALTSEMHSCYSRNMAALTARQPTVAVTVAATATPDFVVAATGRDGTPSFRMEDARGQSQSASRWLGGSSMPGISAREIFAGFVSDGRNVILPGVLTGVEPLVLAEKLPPHAAVFVVEEDPVQLKLVLCAHDYAELIAAGRIVFVLGGAETGRAPGAPGLDCTGGLRDPASWFCQFFEAHPGYELPIHLLPVPQRTSAQIAGLVGRLGRRSRGVLPGVPSVAVLGVDPTPGSLAQARRIERALTLLKWPHSTCVPDAPERCHLAARLAAVEQVNADMILLTNTAGGLKIQNSHLVARQAGFPSDLPVASWLLPGSRHQAPSTLSADSSQVYFASGLSVYDALIGAGCRSDMIEQCGVAADTIAFRPLGRQAGFGSRQAGLPGPPGGKSRAHNADVVVIADLPDARAEGCNITLDSHVALWRALTEVVRRHVDEGLSGMSEALLSEAEQMSHTTVREPEVRDQFVRLLQDRLVPAGRAGAVVEALRGAGHRVGVWGLNWPRLGGDVDVRCGPIPGVETLNQIFNTVGVVVIADPLPWGVQSALDAIASGAAVVCSGGAEPFKKEHPCLTAIQECLHLFETMGDLIRHVDSLVNVSRKRGENALAATELIRGEHSVCRRLEQIADTIRRRQAQTRKG